MCAMAHKSRRPNPNAKSAPVVTPIGVIPPCLPWGTFPPCRQLATFPACGGLCAIAHIFGVVVFNLSPIGDIPAKRWAGALMFPIRRGDIWVDILPDIRVDLAGTGCNRNATA